MDEPRAEIMAVTQGSGPKVSSGEATKLRQASYRANSALIAKLMCEDLRVQKAAVRMVVSMSVAVAVDVGKLVGSGGPLHCPLIFAVLIFAVLRAHSTGRQEGEGSREGSRRCEGS